jgi:hypothetical protein
MGFLAFPNRAIRCGIRYVSVACEAWMSDLELIERFLSDIFIALTQHFDAVDTELARLREET